MHQTKWQISRNKFLDKDQRNSLLKFCKVKAERDLIFGRKIWVTRYTLVYTALFTGLRVCELASLELRDLHLNRTPPYIRIRAGKGNKPRDVTISTKLAKHLKTYVEHKANFNESTEPDAPLFTGRDNVSHCSRECLQKSFREACLQSGVGNYGIHTARHTYATHLLMVKATDIVGGGVWGRRPHTLSKPTLLVSRSCDTVT